MSLSTGVNDVRGTSGSILLLCSTFDTTNLSCVCVCVVVIVSVTCLVSVPPPHRSSYKDCNTLHLPMERFSPVRRFSDGAATIQAFKAHLENSSLIRQLKQVGPPASVCRWETAAGGRARLLACGRRGDAKLAAVSQVTREQHLGLTLPVLMSWFGQSVAHIPPEAAID